MESIVGLAGAHRNSCVAVWRDGTFTGVCELERITRIRRATMARGSLPETVLDAIDPHYRARDTTFVKAEQDIVLPTGVRAVTLDHHHGHAACAFLTSPFEQAAVLVCDGHAGDGLTAWLGDGADVMPLPWRWTGPSLASIYTRCAEVFGFPGPGHEYRLEALARLGAGAASDRICRLWRYADGGLCVSPDWERHLSAHVAASGESIDARAEIASAIHCQLRDVLLEVLDAIKAASGMENVCLGGGLFYNSYLTTAIRECGPFARTFVPINPGNAGLAVGAALAIAARRTGCRPDPPGPFLGPEYDLGEVKETLDNCKLTYAFPSEPDLIKTVLHALRSGGLVGWFDGRMEWGHRALGHRSILADPRLPHVLDNLNLFLKMRQRHHTYGLSVLAEHADCHFTGPSASRFMEHEYRPRDPELFRPMLPGRANTLRVQTIDSTPSLFRDLHQAYAVATGIGVLVNTSFNGFGEPIVCSPRDAIRVFYGTALDLLVVGRFLLSK